MPIERRADESCLRSCASFVSQYPLYNGMQGVIEYFEEYQFPEPAYKKLSNIPDETEEEREVREKRVQAKRAELYREQVKGFTRIPVVRFGSGALVRIPPLTYEHGKKAAFSEPLTTRTQIPLKLAFAMSIHKCQGTTLDNVKVSIMSLWLPKSCRGR